MSGRSPSRGLLTVADDIAHLREPRTGNPDDRFAQIYGLGESNVLQRHSKAEIPNQASVMHDIHRREERKRSELTILIRARYYGVHHLVFRGCGPVCWY